MNDVKRESQSLAVDDCDEKRGVCTPMPDRVDFSETEETTVDHGVEVEVSSEIDIALRERSYDTSSAGVHAFATSASCVPASTRTNTRTNTTNTQNTELTDADVVSGRSPMTYAHPGNKFYNSLVKSSCKQYKGASTRDEKSRIVDEVIAQIERSGGRFVVPEGGKLVEVRTLMNGEREPSRSKRHS
jgi:hypothetical protein